MTGNVLPKEKLIRFVVDQEGILTPDIGGKLPGRGVWVTATRKNVISAVQKKLFQRGFNGTIIIDPGILDKITFLLEERLIGFLGLMRRMGAIVAGFEKLGSWIKKGQIAIILTAQDSIASDLNKLLGLAPNLKVISVLTKAQLNKAFGEANYVYIGLKRSGLFEQFMSDLQRLQGLHDNPI